MDMSDSQILAKYNEVVYKKRIFIFFKQKNEKKNQKSI